MQDDLRWQRQDTDCTLAGPRQLQPKPHLPWLATYLSLLCNSTCRAVDLGMRQDRRTNVSSLRSWLGSLPSHPLPLGHRLTSRDPELLAAAVLKGLQRDPHFLTQISCALWSLWVKPPLRFCLHVTELCSSSWEQKGAVFDQLVVSELTSANYRDVSLSKRCLINSRGFLHRACTFLHHGLLTRLIIPRMNFPLMEQASDPIRK